jgi:hypothetical protein
LESLKEQINTHPDVQKVELTATGGGRGGRWWPKSASPVVPSWNPIVSCAEPRPIRMGRWSGMSFWPPKGPSPA